MGYTRHKSLIAVVPRNKTLTASSWNGNLNDFVSWQYENLDETKLVQIGKSGYQYVYMFLKRNLY